MSMRMENGWLILSYSDNTTLYIDIDNIEGIQYYAPNRFNITGTDYKLTWKWPFITSIDTISEYTEYGSIHIFSMGKKHTMRYPYDSITIYRRDLALLKKELNIADTSSSTDPTAD